MSGPARLTGSLWGLRLIFVRLSLAIFVAFIGCSTSATVLINPDSGHGDGGRARTDAGVDAGDSGVSADGGSSDAGFDAGVNEGFDAGSDAGVDSGLSCYPFPALGEAVILTNGASWDLETADFNQDGIDDLVQLQIGLHSFGPTQIYYGLSDGGLKAGPLFPGIGPGLAVGDLNLDGWPDLVVTDQDGLHGFLNIEMNQRDGSFAGYTLSNFGTLWAVAIADFDGDGRPDLATCGTYGISLFFDDGSVVADAGGAPEFSAPVSPIRAGCDDMIAARFTAGGPAGLAFLLDNALFVLLGKGDGGFLGPTVYRPTGVLNSIRAADFNGDGLLDLAVGTLASGVSVLLNLDGGVFGSPIATSVPSGSNVARITLADVNGDGYPDILAADYSYCTPGAPDVLVFLNDCQGGFPFGVALDAGLQGTYAVAAVRSAGKTLPGIVAGGECSGNLAIFPNFSP
jgi:hypothetical protein